MSLRYTRSLCIECFFTHVMWVCPERAAAFSVGHRPTKQRTEGNPSQCHPFVIFNSYACVLRNQIRSLVYYNEA